LEGKAALITGGDSGIGKAVAILFAREGCDVAINYLPEEQSDAEITKKLVEKEGRKCVLIPHDIRGEEVCPHDLNGLMRELQGNRGIGKERGWRIPDSSQ